MGVVDLSLLGATLAEGVIYLSHSTLTGDVWGYVVGGLMFAATIIGLSGATNRFIQMNRYDNECLILEQQVKRESQVAN